MSENLDLVRSIYAAWERGDFSSSEWADPDIEYLWIEGPAPRVWRGLAGMGEAISDVLSAWDDLRLEATDYREIDGTRVFVQFAQHGRGRASGLDLAHVPMGGGHLFEVRDGKVTRLVVYWDPDRALADLGLEDEAASPANVEMVRALFERWQRGDFDTADAFHPEVEFARYGGEVGVTRAARGIEALTAAVVEWTREWTHLSFEAEGFVDLGERVLVFARNRGVGKRSGLALDHLEGDVFTLRDGKIVRWEAYWDPSDAKRALDLEA